MMPGAQEGFFQPDHHGTWWVPMILIMMVMEILLLPAHMQVNIVMVYITMKLQTMTL